jgi:hypothetical protein
MHGTIAQYGFEPQWENGEPVEVRFGKHWCSATVVGVKGLRVCCELLEDVKVILPQGLFGRPCEFIKFVKGDVVPKPFSAVRRYKESAA